MFKQRIDHIDMQQFITFLKTTLLIFIMALTACNGSSKSKDSASVNACQQLALGIEEIKSKVEVANQSADAIDGQAEIAALSAQISQFTEAVGAVLKNTDELYARYDVDCKRYAVSTGNFNAVFDNSYRPFITVHAHLINAIFRTEQKLNRSQSQALVAFSGKLATAGHALARTLNAQKQICDYDFDTTRCQLFADTIKESLNIPSNGKLNTPNNGNDKADSPNNDKADSPNNDKADSPNNDKADSPNNDKFNAPNNGNDKRQNI